MKAISYLLAPIAAALCAVCGATSPYQGSSRRTTADVTTQDCFAAALREHMPGALASNRVPGAVVSYIKNGEVAWTKAFGVANLQTGTPMRPDMVFNHGSNGKVMTAWALMRLVEAENVELDAPANRYLKRWQIRSAEFDPKGVTPRRVLSHTAGLTVHGFADYEQGTKLPSLVDVLEGRNQDDGAVYIKWEPGSTHVYSGGGYVIAQMIIEDVSGEPFAAFMEREVAKPLGLSSLDWVWTPELERRAPTPYDRHGRPVGYRQLASQAIGSEICSVADFARFLAAAVSGPRAEPPGRGVLNQRRFPRCLKSNRMRGTAVLVMASARSRATKSSVIRGPIPAGMPIFNSVLVDGRDLSSPTTHPVEPPSTNQSVNSGIKHVVRRALCEDGASEVRVDNVFRHLRPRCDTGRGAGGSRPAARRVAQPLERDCPRQARHHRRYGVAACTISENVAAAWMRLQGDWDLHQAIQRERRRAS